MSSRKLIDALRRHKGLTRKSCIRVLANIFTTECKYDDAGWFKASNDEYIVISTDGITEDLVKSNPLRAGFYSVLANVNDVVAKGAKPIGFAGVIASENPVTRLKLTMGIKQALDLYGVKILKMHVHPDATFDSVSGTIIGLAKEIVPSSTAKISDHIVIGIDTSGEFGTDGWVRTFDSIQKLNKEEVFKRTNAIIQIAENKFANASRDISAPGILGSLAMLCESSLIGALVRIEDIPKPDNVELEKWLTCYPSFGFILATSSPKKCIEILAENGYESGVVGKIVEERKIKVEYQGEKVTFLDLEKQSIFGNP